MMMVSLLLYAYCIGLPSSRKIEKATYHSIAFRVLTANQHPDYDTISDFRKRHLKALATLFRGSLMTSLLYPVQDAPAVPANDQLFTDVLLAASALVGNPPVLIRTLVDFDAWLPANDW